MFVRLTLNVEARELHGMNLRTIEPMMGDGEQEWVEGPSGRLGVCQPIA
jgi:hypothetical protein